MKETEKRTQTFHMSEHLVAVESDMETQELYYLKLTLEELATYFLITIGSKEGIVSNM